MRPVTRFHFCTAPFALFLLLLGVICSRPYQYSLYDMDMLGYLGNAAVMMTRDPVEIHKIVYDEIHANVPNPPLDHLLGKDPNVPSDHNAPGRDRASNPYHFAEFLPCFAIRPLFNEMLYVMHRFGVGLVRSTVIIAVASFFLLGVLIFVWLTPYTGEFVSALVTLLLMASPPMLNLARFNTPDSLSALVCLAALYFLLERHWELIGYLLLLLSVYVRTDNAVLALLAISFLVLKKELRLWQGLVLSLVAVGSVFVINHFSGDYGIRLLYYRSFIAVPLAPGEIVPRFSVRDYGHAFRAALSVILNGYTPVFLLLGVAGLAGRVRRVPAELAVLAALYILLHLLLFPSGQERFFGPLFVALTVFTTTSAATRRHEAGFAAPSSAE
jgi:hypothetical protein